MEGLIIVAVAVVLVGVPHFWCEADVEVDAAAAAIAAIIAAFPGCTSCETCSRIGKFGSG